MKSNDFINENIVMDAHEMHKDHEVQMARKDCYHAAEDAIALHKLLRNVSEEQGVESWVFAKITLANDYLRTVREYMEYNLMNPDQSAGMATEPTPEMPIAENASSGASGAGNMAGVNNPKTKKAKSKVGTLFGGTYKAKGSPFAESKKTNVKPGQSGLDKILASYPQEVESFKNGGDLDYDLEAALWEYYNSRGEWNDKYDATGWISKQLARYLSRKNKGMAEGLNPQVTYVIIYTDTHGHKKKQTIKSSRGLEYVWKKFEQDNPGFRVSGFSSINDDEQGVAEGYSLKKIKREK